MAKIKRGRYLPTARKLKVIQNTLASCTLKLKRLVEEVQSVELDFRAAQNRKKKASGDEAAIIGKDAFKLPVKESESKSAYDAYARSFEGQG